MDLEINTQLSSTGSCIEARPSRSNTLGVEVIAVADSRGAFIRACRNCIPSAHGCAITLNLNAGSSTERRNRRHRSFYTWKREDISFRSGGFSTALLRDACKCTEKTGECLDLSLAFLNSQTCVQQSIVIIELVKYS